MLSKLSSLIFLLGTMVLVASLRKLCLPKVIKIFPYVFFISFMVFSFTFRFMICSGLTCRARYRLGSFSAHARLILLVPFVEKNAFSAANGLGTSVKHQLAVYIRVCFWTDHFVQLVYL